MSGGEKLKEEAGATGGRQEEEKERGDKELKARRRKSMM